MSCLKGSAAPTHLPLEISKKATAFQWETLVDMNSLKTLLLCWEFCFELLSNVQLQSSMWLMLLHWTFDINLTEKSMRFKAWWFCIASALCWPHFAPCASSCWSQDSPWVYWFQQEQHPAFLLRRCSATLLHGAWISRKLVLFMGFFFPGKSVMLLLLIWYVGRQC